MGMVRAVVWCCLWLLCTAARAELPPENVHAIGNEDGIVLSRYDRAGQAIPGFRGEVTVEAPLAQVLAVLEDVDAHAAWMYRCAESMELGRGTGGERVIYNRTDVPWPIWDRDVVLVTERADTADPARLVLRFHADADARVPVPRRVVRMPRLDGFYELRREGPKRTRVVYQVDADIGGSVPRWAAERVARDMPLHTLRALRRRVERLERH
jgi:Polyketide cyclase / dehydrase and lipid transport